MMIWMKTMCTKSQRKPSKTLKVMTVTAWVKTAVLCRGGPPGERKMMMTLMKILCAQVQTRQSGTLEVMVVA